MTHYEIYKSKKHLRGNAAAWAGGVGNPSVTVRAAAAQHKSFLTTSGGSNSEMQILNIQPWQKPTNTNINISQASLESNLGNDMALITLPIKGIIPSVKEIRKNLETISTRRVEPNLKNENSMSDGKYER